MLTVCLRLRFLGVGAADFGAAHLAREGFGKLLYKFHDARVFVGRRVLFDVVLQLFDKLGRALEAGAENYRRLYEKSADAVGIGNSGDGDLKYRRVLLKDRLDLKGADSVARRFDYVVVPSDVAEAAVLVAVGVSTGHA